MSEESEEKKESEEKVKEAATKTEEPSEAEKTTEKEKPEEKAEALEKKIPEEEAEEEIEIVEEKIYTVPLQRAWLRPRKKRAPRATRILKTFIQRHMKLGKAEAEEEEGEERLVISNEVNERIWRRGIEKPPRKIRVRAVKDVEGTVTVYLAEGD